MTTTGIMTAIAILAPELSPPDPPEPEVALRAEGVDEAEDVREDVSDVVAVVGLVAEYVEVMTTTVGANVVPDEVGVLVTVSVTATTLADSVLVVDGGTYVVEGVTEMVETMVLREEDVDTDAEVDVKVAVSDVMVTVEKEVVKLVEVLVDTVVMTLAVSLELSEHR